MNDKMCGHWADGSPLVLRNCIVCLRARITGVEAERDALKARACPSCGRDGGGTVPDVVTLQAKALRSAEAREKAKDERITALEDALRGVVAEPHGCSFCDAGLLRSAKPHAGDCPYEVAVDLLAPTPPAEKPCPGPDCKHLHAKGSDPDDFNEGAPCVCETSGQPHGDGYTCDGPPAEKLTGTGEKPV